jgi:hypothetical protein
MPPLRRKRMKIEYNVICPNLEAATRIKAFGRVTEIYFKEAEK